VKVTVRKEGAAAVVELDGDLDSSMPEGVRRRIGALVSPGRSIVFDLSRVTRVSGTGLRMLLLLARHAQAVGATVSARAVPEELLETARAAGFLPLINRPLSSAPPPPPLRRARIDAYPTHRHDGFALRAGAPVPLGASEVARGVNFAVFSRHATSCTLVLLEAGRSEPVAEIPFPPEFRIGDVFAMVVFDLDLDRLEYGFRMTGPSDRRAGHRFDQSALLLDPFARCLSGGEAWGEEAGQRRARQYRARLAPEDFDWEGDRQLELPMEELVIYEMHVRGFTRSPSAGVAFPGTFAGVVERIPHLVDLGANCVELMPVVEFDELENDRRIPATGDRLHNYWGYSSVGFFAPKASYAASGWAGMQCDELKAMVKELHRKGIEVILDVVFNHTAEGDERGHTFSFRGLDNRTYYMLTPDGRYRNFSGCGNTLNCNHPVVRDLILACLRHWVAEYHIDGFRFDLASILGRDADGHPLANPPLLEALALDPVLGRTKLVAEAWDAGGLYQVGSFPAYGRWAEWNGRFRDCARRFLKGDEGQTEEMAQRLLGSPDLYPTRGPAASVNFVTCHDGFTLADLVSYDRKHNETNGEGNRDGTDDNLSWNCGVEGPTSDPAVRLLRLQQIKNAVTLLLLAQGVPMLPMGDEMGRTQGGNNNAYCHDGPLTWLDWGLQATNAEILRFCRGMIAFRRCHPALRHPAHHGIESGDPDPLEVTWHGVRPGAPDWSHSSHVVAFTVRRRLDGSDDCIYAAFNMYWKPLRFRLPRPPAGTAWHLFASTAAAPPGDIRAPGEEELLSDQRAVTLAGRSTLVLVARQAAAGMSP
jgi:isoamylase